MRHDRTVIGYHGCDEAVARRLLAGEPFRKSKNDFDWLGEGIYFWEYGKDRALQFAREQQRRGKVERPSVVGALLHLGNCFDLMDTRFTTELGEAFDLFRSLYAEQGRALPANRGSTADLLLRHRDNAVLNFYFDHLSARQRSYDSVRGCFTEGSAAFEGSGIFSKSHIQIAVRNEACILGLFQPRNDHEALPAQPRLPPAAARSR